MSQHTHLTEELQERAGLYALGLLSDDEADQFRSHLASGCRACEAEVANSEAALSLLPMTLPPCSPSPSVRERLMSRVRASQLPPGMKVVRSGEGTWKDTPFPGVSTRLLDYDRETDRVTVLLRFAPGATYPSHRHRGAEQCLVLEGDVESAGVRLTAGDYSVAPAASVHGVLCSESGCLLLIMASRGDEILT